MTFRRRAFRRFGGRRTAREPVIWERGTNLLTSVNGSIGAAQLFIPDSLTFSGLDQELTLKRMRLILHGISVVSGAIANVLLFIMVYVRGQQDATDRDPQMLTDTDANADVLWRGVMRVRNDSSPTLGVRVYEEADIRTARRLDQNQAVAITSKPVNAATGASLSDGTYNLHVTFSNLFSRSMRR